MSRSETVWIVDDDRSIRWVLEKALQQEGMTTQSFDSADGVMHRLLAATANEPERAAASKATSAWTGGNRLGMGARCPYCMSVGVSSGSGGLPNGATPVLGGTGVAHRSRHSNVESSP